MASIFILLFFILLLLLVVWLPYFKQDKAQQHADLVNSTQHSIRVQTNINLYHEHKAEIEKDFADGGIDQENYQYLLAELDKSLLQDIDTAETNTAAPSQAKAFGIIWPLSLSLFIVIFSTLLYVKQGTLANLMAAPVASESQQQSMSVAQQAQQRQQQMSDLITELQSHIEKNPDDAQAWYNLGQTLVGTGEFAQAIAAFEQVMRIEGEHADLIGAIAQASYYQNNQQIDENIQGLIDKALALDAKDPAVNILLGMHNFIEQEYQRAINYWQVVIDDNRQGVNIAALQEAVKEAQKRLATSVTDTVDNNQSPSQTAQQITGPQLQVQVSLSADIAEHLAKTEDKVVFVYALPTSGQRIPLAAVKIMASDLPKVITLNNSQAMSAQHKLSSVEQVNIFAIVSNQGGVGIKPGDYKGEANNIAVNGNQTINLVVNQLVTEP